MLTIRVALCLSGHLGTRVTSHQVQSVECNDGKTGAPLPIGTRVLGALDRRVSKLHVLICPVCLSVYNSRASDGIFVKTFLISRTFTESLFMRYNHGHLKQLPAFLP